MDNQSDPNEITLKVPPEHAALLAKYLRRATFSNTASHCDGWPYHDFVDQCYEMIAILQNLENQLNEQR